MRERTGSRSQRFSWCAQKPTDGLTGSRRAYTHLVQDFVIFHQARILRAQSLNGPGPHRNGGGDKAETQQNQRAPDQIAGGANCARCRAGNETEQHSIGGG